MTGFYDTLKIAYNRCPPDCANCEEVCAQTKNAGGPGLIKPVHLSFANYHSVTTCSQCSEPACRSVCPTGAIVKGEADGVVRVDTEKCVGCGLCTVACPYGGMFYHPATRKAAKCDTCIGRPKCVEACSHGVLEFKKSLPVVNLLGEDQVTKGMALCQGCGAELGIRFALRVLGEKVIAFGGPGCGALALAGTEFGVMRKGPGFIGFMTNIPSCMTGASRFYHRTGQDVLCVAFAGDGLTADVGFQPLSGAAERGEKIIYICYDNEAYMNTGIQRSSTTPFKSWTTTTPVGKKMSGKNRVPKNVPLIMAFHGVTYVATASIAYLEDFVEKLAKAKKFVKEGMVYIHLLTPCPTGWRAPANSTVEMARMAVETNYFPLWEFARGKFRITYRPVMKRPISEFTGLMGRFRHLNKDDLVEVQKVVDERFSLLEALTSLQCSNPNRDS